MGVKSLCQSMMRKMPLDQIKSDTSLNRCLNVFDLTVLGIGAMVGSGIYVMTGKACKEQAGPSIVVSFVLAALVLVVVAGCYTEFATRLHKTGSMYLYMYIVLGELAAFLIGFITIFMSICSGAVNARAWSSYLDSVFKGVISNYTSSITGDWSGHRPLADYPDLVAMSALIVMTLVISLGAKCSSWFNTVFAVLNILILMFVTIMGFIYGDLHNWTNKDHGGFFPYGISGVLTASAVCFWAYSGFEILSCAVEEAKNPRRDIAIATVTSLALVMVLYVGTSASMTLIVPYYEITINAPIPSVFAARGLHWAQLIVSVGPLLGLTTTMMASLYGSVRIAFKMSEDGLLPEFMSKTNSYTKVPVYSVIMLGSMSATVALFFDISELIEFGVIFVLVSYSLICCCVVSMRYRPHESHSQNTNSTSSTSTDADQTVTYSEVLGEEPPDNFILDNDSASGTSRSQNRMQDLQISNATSSSGNKKHRQGALKENFHWLWPCSRLSPGVWPGIAIVLITLLMVIASVISIHWAESFLEGAWWAVGLFSCCMLGILTLLFTLCAHEQNTHQLVVKMPLVPVLPVASSSVSLYMLVALAKTFDLIGIAVLLAIGLVLYFAYGLRHSKLKVLTYSHFQTVPDTSQSHSDTRPLLNGQDAEEDDYDL